MNNRNLMSILAILATAVVVVPLLGLVDMTKASRACCAGRIVGRRPKCSSSTRGSP